MGGDEVDDDPSSSGDCPSEGEPYVDDEIPQLLHPRIPSPLRNCEGSAKVEDHELVVGDADEVNSGFCGLDVNVNWMTEAAYGEVLKSYSLPVSRESLAQARSKILSYNPGAWIEEVGGTKLSDYHVPQTTCLMLIGPKGSGKSSLVNRISKVFEDDKLASERAQVTFNSSAGDGTYFLHEYMIPRRSTSFCLYDTRSLSSDPLQNTKMIRRWMLKGVCHGELVTRESDNSELRKIMKYKARWKGQPSFAIRTVNFVIFVVNGLSVLESMEGKDDRECSYVDMVATTYSLPYLSFKDDKPVVVVTHGDLLSVTDRARIRVYLGERLGIPPMKQVFDIPESSDPLTELTTINMVRYSLEHADRNLPLRKTCFSEKVPRAATILRILYLSVILWPAIVLAIRHRAHRLRPEPDIKIDWASIRHMWLA